MNRLAIVLLLSAALGGCLTPSAYRQSKSLIGQPMSEAVAIYGPPDAPVTEGARAYSWSRGRWTGACRLDVKTDPSGRIVNASVVALGFDTCKSVLKHTRRAG